jgi:peptidyl-dipeptidase Dcp
VYDRRDALKLDPESRRLVERYHENFVRAGAKLSDADKARLKAMNAEMARLGTQFSQNVLNEVNASAVVVDDEGSSMACPPSRSPPPRQPQRRASWKAST